MQHCVIAAVSLNQTPLDWDQNKKNILQAIANARKANASIVCLPELSVTGYGCEDMFLAPDVAATALKIVYEILPNTEKMAVAVGLPLLYQGKLYNSICMMIDGKISGFVLKQYLAGKGIYYEPRWFSAWPLSTIETIHIGCESYAIGALIFNFNGIKIGFEICEEAWVQQRVATQLATLNVDVILNPSASHFEMGKVITRRRIVKEAANTFNIAYVYANILGNESGRMIYDGDTIIGIGSEKLIIGPRFSFQSQMMSVASVDLQKLRNNRKTAQDVTRVQIENDIGSATVSGWEASQYLREEEFTRAVGLALFDYIRKSRLNGFVVNISGGADSAAVVCLVYWMVVLALHELGEKTFRQKLSHCFPEAEPIGEEPLTSCLSRLIYCLYQGTENSSELTWDAARSFCDSLHIELSRLSIQSIVNTYQELLQSVIQRALNWEKDDIPLQNIQARVRGPSAWMLANLRNAILLTTLNRSEAAIGYMTMDGDSCGALSPLAGVDKTFILHWLQWLEGIGPDQQGPLSGLKVINRMEPKAELRPPHLAQTDEGDLMPYHWLVAIEHLFLEQRAFPLDILLNLKYQYPETELENIAQNIDCFFQRWSKNQWKRERTAPAFHVDTVSVDPKTWCRFPILSGNFKHELRKMWLYVKENASLGSVLE